MAPPEAAAMMSSWASVRSWAAGLPAAFIAASAPVGMKVSIAFSLSSPDAPPSCPRTRRSSAHLFGDARSRGTLGRKAWMNHGAVAGERRRLHDLVVPLDRERFRVLVHQNFEEGEKVLGVEARSGRGDPGRHVAMAEPGRIEATMSLEMSRGAGRPGISAVVITMSCFLMCSATSAACLA